MRVRMMTFHTPKNYGAVLQAYSLMSFLKRRCDDVKIIDFNTPNLRGLYPLVPHVTSLRSFISALLSAPRLPGKREKFRKFDSFVKNSFDLTQRFESFEDLLKESWGEDVVFVTGSDQTFNPNRAEDERRAFYLTFVPEGNFKFSYAGSFGVSSVSEKLKPFVKSSLENFNKLSTREASGVLIIRDLLDKSVTETLDPVFLNDSTFWKKSAKPYKKRYEKYSLYYRLLGTSQGDRMAEEIAKKQGLKLVVVTGKHCLGLRSSATLYDVGPEELLSLYDGADYVVTDSFHGVAFSLIFEKRFSFVDFDSRLNARGLNLLQKAGLEKIAFSTDSQTSQIFDYRQINKRLNSWKSQSVDFLESALEEAKAHIEQRG